MKRSLFTIMMFTLAIIPALSEGIKFGIYVAPNTAYFKPNNLDFGTDSFMVANQGVGFGFKAGIGLDYFLDDDQRYSFHSGLSISKTGGRLISDSNTTTTYHSDIKYKLQYIEIPLTLRLRTQEIEGIRYFGQLGATLGVGISAKADLEINGDPLNPMSGINRDVSDDVRLFNLGVYASGGIEYSFTESTAVLIAPFYQNGFANIITSHKGEKTILNQIGLNIGFLF